MSRLDGLIHSAFIDQLRRGIANPVPDPDLDLYALAMTLRGCADGSAEGTATADELLLIGQYINARLRCWGDDRSRSEAAFHDFLLAVMAETASFRWKLRPVGRFYGTWPGDESDDELQAALRRVRGKTDEP
jgi:hypothetical protein